MNHKFQCRCGELSGEVRDIHSAMHVVCCCKDCHAFASHLGESATALDAYGGTRIVAAPAHRVSITNGVSNLACVSLSEKGLLRWYAKCCNTLLANTPRDWQFPYVGLVHSCLITDQNTTASSLPDVQMYVNTGSAGGAPHSGSWQKAKTLLGFMPKIAAARLSGKYKRTPFFSSSGVPVADVAVLTGPERTKAYKKSGGNGG